MGKTILLSIAISFTVFLTGCEGGTSSNMVVADSVSGFKYTKMSCDELGYEMDFLESKARKMGAVVDKVKQDQKNKNVGAFLFCWICAAFIDTNSAEAAKLAEIKGEVEAVERELYRSCRGK
jgi:hypothetical protein